TIYINNNTEPEWIDPGRAHDTASTALVEQMFEGLTAYDAKDLHAVQAVAERWDQSADNRLYRFHLRSNARWSDGKPVTTRDFEYAWKRVLAPATASQVSTNMYCIKNAESFNIGKLRTVRDAIAVLADTKAGAAAVANLPRGAAVTVLGYAPLTV